MSTEQDEDIDVPELVEEIIEVLLTGLKDTVCLNGDIPFLNFFLVISVSLLGDILFLLFDLHHIFVLCPLFFWGGA